VLAKWLEPVTGESALLVTKGQEIHEALSTEYALIGAAVAIAILGIAIAAIRLKPASLVPKAESREEEGFERVLANKWYVDEIYDDAIVEPTLSVSRNVLWKGIDAGLIDGLFVNGSAWLARLFGRIGSAIQSGQVGTYAWILLIGAVAVLGAFTLR
jgi:NADH-quinone oxidoreductase subunit L